MNEKEIAAFAREAAKSIKTEADVNEFRQMLMKATLEEALNAELADHLDTEEDAGKGVSEGSSNSPERIYA